MKDQAPGHLSLSSLEAAENFTRARSYSGEELLSLLRGQREKYSLQERQFALSEMIRHLKNFAPEWLREFENIDAALGIPENSMLELMSLAHLVQDKLDCTSWIVTPELTAAGKMLLHKNRDSAYSPHAPMLFRTPGKLSWIGSCSHFTPFPLMGLNEKGLAVAMNSGESCSKWNRSGFGTPMMARLILENCTTPEEADKLVKELLKGGAYSHGRTGSIFFYANASRGGLTELCAGRSQYISFDFGYMIRANAWHLPGMTAMSRQSSRSIMDKNLIREYMVRDGLNAAADAGGVTPEVCLSITRSRGRMLPAEQIPVCRPTTIASGTFEIDGEFPELSTFYHLSGPARNTIALPLFAGAGVLPGELVSVRWTRRAAAFKEKRGIDHVLLPRLEEVEKKLFKEHDAVGGKAKELFKKGCGEEARKLLKEHTLALFETASRSFEEITGL